MGYGVTILALETSCDNTCAAGPANLLRLNDDPVPDARGDLAYPTSAGCSYSPLAPYWRRCSRAS